MLGFGKETPPLQAYGKLPLAKDYLRVGAGDGAARELREWLDQAFSGRPNEEPPQLPWPMRFVMGGEREALLGTAWPSSDAGGLRRFPFALFVERRRKALIESLARDLALERAWWEKVEAFHSARENFADGQSFLAALRGQTIAAAKGDEDDAAAAESEQIGWDAWLAAMWPVDAQSALFDVMRAIAQLARDAHPSPLRLPLAGGLPVLEQVAAWMRVLLDLEWIERGALPSLFFPEESARAGATFLVASRRPLGARDVAWLAGPPGPAPLDAGDFDDGRARAAGPAALVRGPALADSMRGALATFRARR